MSIQERQQIIQKLMRLPSNESTTSMALIKEKKAKMKKQFIKKRWNDLNKFLQDNSNEVHQKIKAMEQEIWAKLILMEKDCRIMKAYLRFPTININGGLDDFDGLQVGLARFTSTESETSPSYNISPIDSLLYQLKGGLDIKIDAIGNIFMKKNTSMRIVATSIFDTNQTTELTGNYLKVFDLRKFKKKLTKIIETGERDSKVLAKYTFIMITIGTEEMYDKNIFNCDLWITIIHIIAVEMIEAVLREIEERESSQLNTFNMNLGNFNNNKDGVVKRNGVIKSAFTNNKDDKNERKYIKSDILKESGRIIQNNRNDSGGLQLKSYNNILLSEDKNNNFDFQRYKDHREIFHKNSRIPRSSSQSPLISSTIFNPLQNSLSSTSSGISSSGSIKHITANYAFKQTSLDDSPIRLCKYKQHCDDMKETNIIYPYNRTIAEITNNNKINKNDKNEPSILIKSKRSNIKDDWICHQAINPNKKNKMRSRSVFNENKKKDSKNNSQQDNDSFSFSYEKKDSTNNYLLPSEPIKRLAKWKSEKSLFF
uniref:MH2 domain-containing protein n=1 Tax=Parastrongyloides trichosuri TaxID=131310 RepID=A0A0N4ZIK0_PARTI